MKLTLEFITPNAEEAIGFYAGECYAAKRDKEVCIKRAAKCAQDGHLATLRFAHAVFHVEGISRACSHQLVRSKHLDFLQQSQRYVNQSDAHFYYPGTKMDTKISGAYQSAMVVYNELIEMGVKKEDARFVLPEGLHTSLFVVGNLQAWKDFIKLRADKHAQKEIRELAVKINNVLAEHCPHIFNWMPEIV